MTIPNNCITDSFLLSFERDPVNPILYLRSLKAESEAVAKDEEDEAE